ncbi:MAG: hypothetical protein R3E97_01380 [Candidatus Eisenbacteria bacterium]
MPPRNASSVRALFLAPVAVDRFRLDATATEMARESRRSHLRLREDDRTSHVVLTDQILEDVRLLVAIHTHDELLHLVDGGGRRRDFDPDRFFQQLLGKPGDVGAERGREQHGLPFRRDLPDDLEDILDESHVEHPVRFVEHEDFGVPVVDVAAPHMVDEPAGSGDEDVDTVTEHHLLRLDRNAAIGAGRRDAGVGGVGVDVLRDLDRQLPGGNEDQRAEVILLTLEQTVEDRQCEGCRLARAGLRAGHDVIPLQEERDCLRLNGCGFAVLDLFQSTRDLGPEPEVLERHSLPS